VYADPSEVFDTILDNEKIIERAKSVTEAYDDFINAAQTWGASGMWDKDWADSPNM
jgi:ribonucleoside-diphosphate reductase beta chain